MPTGYTYKVVDGELTEFKKFAARCARAFVPLILLRDEPMTDELPESPGQEGDHEERALVEHEARLAELLNMSDDEASAAANGEHEARVKSASLYASSRELENARLARMASKVWAWVPPTAEHSRLKDFMLEQIEISKSSVTFYDQPSESPLPGAEWLRDSVSRLREHIERSKVRIAEKTEREAGRKRWLEQLRESLNNYQEPTDAPNLER